MTTESKDSKTFQLKLRQAEQLLASNDSKLAAVIVRVGACTLTPHTDYWHELVDSIISQQLSIKASATIVGRFADLGAGEFPAPYEVVGFSHEQLRAVGLSGAKARYVQDLAQHIVDGRIDLGRLPELGNEEIITELTDVKGIGEWTAHMFLIFSLGRLDVLPIGDLGVRRGIQILYELDTLPDPIQIRKIADRGRWGGYESVAAWYIWRVQDLNL